MRAAVRSKEEKPAKPKKSVAKKSAPTPPAAEVDAHRVEQRPQVLHVEGERTGDQHGAGHRRGRTRCRGGADVVGQFGVAPQSAERYRQLGAQVGLNVRDGRMAGDAHSKLSKAIVFPPISTSMPPS